MDDILPREIRLELKDEYIKLIKRLGYTITFDLDTVCDDPLYDLQFLITRIDEDADEFTRKKYITFMIPFQSILGFRNFKRMYIDGNRADQAKFSQGVKNRMLEYTLDDVVAVLLSEGMHIQTIYQFKQGKGRLYLNREIIETLCTSLNTKGSPLENNYIRQKRIGERRQ
jgi:hypothetical protein